MIRRPAFVAAGGWVGGKALLVAFGGAHSSLAWWVVWLTIAGVVWIEEPRWRSQLSPPSKG